MCVCECAFAPLCFSAWLWNRYYGSSEGENGWELCFFLRLNVKWAMKRPASQPVLEKNAAVKFNYIKWTGLKMSGSVSNWARFNSQNTLFTSLNVIWVQRQCYWDEDFYRQKGLSAVNVQDSAQWCHWRWQIITNCQCPTFGGIRISYRKAGGVIFYFELQHKSSSDIHFWPLSVLNSHYRENMTCRW